MDLGTGVTMIKPALSVPLKAKPGREDEVERLDERR
jgi:hypothetical protein